MDIMDDFQESKSLTYHCIKEGCSSYFVSDKGTRYFMVCKLHGDERPVMRYDGKKEKDLVDDSSDGERYLTKEQSKEMLSIIDKCFSRILTGNDYFRELARFWKDNGYEEYSEDALTYIK